MRLSVDHATNYAFDPPMRGVVQSLRLTPTAFEAQQILDWDIALDGAKRGAAFRDGAGDWIETITLLGPVDLLTITVRGTVETRDTGGVLRGHRERIVPEAYLRPTHATRPDRALRDLAAGAVDGLDAGDHLSLAHALSNAVADAITYTPGETEHGTSAAEALALGHGVCQDHAHALIAAAIALEMPARYVTGYLFSDAKGEAHEASHAWAEVFVPDLGWVGFDPANRVCPDARYIRLGSGADAIEAAPIRGVSLGLGTEVLNVSVTISEAQDQSQQ